MKEESKGHPKLRLDMVYQLKCALLEGFSRLEKTGNRCVQCREVDQDFTPEVEVF